MTRLRLALLAGFVLGVTSALLLVFVVPRITDEPAQSSAPGDRGRWMNVTYPTVVEVATQSGSQRVLVFGEASDPNRMNLVYIAATSTPGNPGMHVDGATGDVLKEYFDQGDPIQIAIVEAIKRGIAYEPFDAAAAPWPYRDDTPAPGDGPPDSDPLSGIQQRLFRNGGPGVRYENWRSQLDVYDDTGDYFCDVEVADTEAFTRLLAGLKLAGRSLRPGTPTAGHAPCGLLP